MNVPCIRRLRIFATGSVAALLAACGGGGSDTGWAPAATPVATASIAAKPVAEAKAEPVEMGTAAAIVNAPVTALAAYGMAAAAVRPAGRGSNHLAVAGPPAELSQ